MTLARAWRRQLYGASSAALIVPFAMLAALAVLALGGGFRGVGVLGQIFAGPPVPNVAGGAGSAAGSGGGAGITVARALPVVPAAALRPVVPGGTGRRRVTRVLPVGAGPRRGGGALTPVGAATPIVAAGGPTSAPAGPGSTGSGSAGSGSAGSGSTGSAPAPGAPQPAPTPKPTVVDQVVKAVTPVTQQLPAPAGPVATQAIQAAGAAADSVLPPGVVQAPAVQAPAVQAPAVQAPAVQAPAVQAPAAQAPAALAGLKLR